MERREAIKYTTLFLGTTLSASTIAALIEGCTVDSSDQWKPAFFSQEEIAFLLSLAETILPTTETPGAKEALVHRYLDTIRPLRYKTEENEAFRQALKSFIDEAKAALGTSLHKASENKRLAWVVTTDKNAFDAILDKKEIPEADRPFYLTLKEQILAGYFSSEAVAKNYFAFDPIPGRYDPCIPFADIGRAWAI